MRWLHGRARGDDVLPDRLAAAAARDDVVERQPAAADAAVDAAPAVAREERAARDLPLHAVRDADVGDQPDHVRPGNDVDADVSGRSSSLEHLRLALEHEHVRPPDGGHVQRLVARVQDENLVQNTWES